MSQKFPIPVFKHPIIETHCHLDYLKGKPYNRFLDAAQAVNIDRILTIAVSPDNLQTVMQLAQSHSQVTGHARRTPHDAKDYTTETDAQIRANALHDKILAIGEIEH